MLIWAHLTWKQFLQSSQRIWVTLLETTLEQDPHWLSGIYKGEVHRWGGRFYKISNLKICIKEQKVLWPSVFKLEGRMLKHMGENLGDKMHTKKFVLL